MLQETEFDVRTLFHEAAHDFFVRTRGTHRQFTHSVRIQEQRIHADRELLRRALDNLLDNSFRFTALGTGRIALEVSLPEPDMLEVRVRDEGPGIPAAARPSLFHLRTVLPGGRGPAASP